MKIRPVGAELFHADGQIDRETNRRDGINSRFSQFFERGLKIQFLVELRKYLTFQYRPRYTVWTFHSSYAVDLVAPCLAISFKSTVN